MRGELGFEEPDATRTLSPLSDNKSKNEMGKGPLEGVSKNVRRGLLRLERSENYQ